MNDNRTHRGLSTYMVECGRRVEMALFYENSEVLAADRMSAIRRRFLSLPGGRRQVYPQAEQDRDQQALDPVNNDHAPWVVCPCETCEERRRETLVRWYPGLRLVGLSPKNEEEL